MVTNTAGKVIIGDYGLSPNRYKEDYYWSSNVAIPIRWAAPETVRCTMDTIVALKVSVISESKYTHTIMHNPSLHLYTYKDYLPT